jgi:hypothetical protein
LEKEELVSIILPRTAVELRRENKLLCVEIPASEEIFDELIIKKHELGDIDDEDERSRTDVEDENDSLVVVEVLMRTLPFVQMISDLVNIRGDGRDGSEVMMTDDKVSELFVGDVEHADVMVNSDMVKLLQIILTPFTPKHPFPTLN